MKYHAALLAFAATLGAAVGHAAEPAAGAALPAAPRSRAAIGRIFFSPAERQRRRGGLVAASPVVDNGGTPERLVVNGALSTAMRGRTVWVNGAAVEDSAARRSAWTDRNGNVWIVDGAKGTRLMRPGQSIDSDGAIKDLLPPGSVIRH